MPFTPAVGYNTLRRLVHLVCKIVARHSALLGAVSADYPTVGTALSSLIAACALTGFDHVPEIRE